MGFRDVFYRECFRLISRPIYIICMIGVPVFCYIFFTTLFWQGVPQRLPVAVVDNDHSEFSRSLVRKLEAMSAVEVKSDYESYAAALGAMQRGSIYAFMVIPENFQRNALSDKQPELGFFSNDAYFVAGLFSYKALKLAGMLAGASVTVTKLQAKGLEKVTLEGITQPVVTGIFALGNPWVSYSIFLNNVILPAMLELMILLMTVFALGIEIKEKTSRRLLIIGGRSILRVIAGKLLPQTLIFTLMGWLLNIYLYAYLHFPLQNGILPMMLATFLLVVSSQAIGVFMAGCLPTLRLGLSFASLFGIVAFSIVGFSLPVIAMYAPFKVLSWLYPVRHYFLIYADQALNGYPLWYSLHHYIFLLLFLFLPLIIIGRLKKSYYDQNYKP